MGASQAPKEALRRRSHVQVVDVLTSAGLWGVSTPGPMQVEAAAAVKQYVPLDPARRPVIQVPHNVDGVLDGLLPLAQGRVLERRLGGQQLELRVLRVHLLEGLVVVQVVAVPVETPRRPQRRTRRTRKKPSPPPR